MKRPLAIVALVYVGGIVLAEYFSLPLPWLFLISFFLVGIALTFSPAGPILFWPAIFLVGWTNAVFHTEIISPFDLRKQIGNRIELVTVRGKLCATPRQKIFMRDEEESWRSISKIETDFYFKNGQWHRTFGKILVTTPDTLSRNFFGGQTVEVIGVLQRPKSAVAEGLFDYRNYLRRQEIYYQLTTTSTNDWKILDEKNHSNTPPFSDRFLAWSKKTLSLGLPEEDESLRLIWALALDWKTAFTVEAEEPFMRAGTYHIFAVDGLRIAIVSGILIVLFRALQIPRGLCGLLVIPLIWFYTGATGWPASAIRSAIMMTIVIIGWSIHRPGNLLNSLFAAAFLILLWQPQQLFQAGFQLSFFVVLCMALLLPPLEKFHKRFFKTDSFLPDGLRPAWRQQLNGTIHFFSGVLASSVAAWLGSIPLSAYYFHLFSTVSVPANFLVVPLTMLLLMSCVGSLGFGWLPAVAELFNHTNWFLMNCIIDLSKWSADLPAGYFYVSTPAPITIAFSYLLLLTILTGWIFTSRWKWWGIFAISITALVWIFHWQRELTTTRLHILPLNGGESVFVDVPGRANDLLIDCGNQSSVEFVTKPFLRAQGENRLSRLLLTHGDLKNVGGATNIVSDFKVEKVFVSPVKFRSREYRVIENWLGTIPNLKVQINRGGQVGPWKVLHPDAGDKFSQADDGPIVLRGEILGTTFLFLSDLSRAGQNLLLERDKNLKADIVVAGLPRESEPLIDALLDVVQPRIIIVTDAEFPAQERAFRKLRERLAKRNVRVIYCRDSGSITFLIRPGHLKMKLARPENSFPTK